MALALSLGTATVSDAATGTMSVVGGTVGGNGTISGVVNVGAAGNLSPGATLGTLAIDGNLDVSAMADGGTGKLAYGLGALAGNNDRITVTDTLTIGVGKLGFADFAFTDLGGVEPGTYTLITSGSITSGNSLDAANLTGTIGGYYGTIGISGINTTLLVNSLIGSSIVDNKGGGAVNLNTLVTYTVSFSKDMDSATVTAADFGNEGTAPVTIGTVTETSPTSGVFTVLATPTGVGTLRLKVNAGAVLTDVTGKNLVTTEAIVDNTTIMVNTNTTHLQ